MRSAALVRAAACLPARAARGPGRAGRAGPVRLLDRSGQAASGGGVMAIGKDGFCTTCQEPADWCECERGQDGETTTGSEIRPRTPGAGPVRRVPTPEAADAAVLYAATHADPAGVRSPARHQARSSAAARRACSTSSGDLPRPADHRQHQRGGPGPLDGDDPPTLLLDEADTVFGKPLKGDEKPRAPARHPQRRAFGRNRPYIRWDITTRRPSGARRSPWRSSPGSATCPTRSRTGPSSSPCAAGRPARRSPGTATAATRRAAQAWAHRLGAWVRAHLGRASATPSPTCREDRDRPRPGSR